MWKYPVDPLAGLVGVIEGVILEQLRLEAIVDLAEGRLQIPSFSDHRAISPCRRH